MPDQADRPYRAQGLVSDAQSLNPSFGQGRAVGSVDSWEFARPLGQVEGHFSGFDVVLGAARSAGKAGALGQAMWRRRELTV
ncbi:hypothetical protein [Streptomyces sp. NPDC017993]|uniref:hypothetical protein n=1 Tax=Streptomyces sp. NPDC017993 TaxID=3365027 RepID=UPI0037B1FB88